MAEEPTLIAVCISCGKPLEEGNPNSLCWECINKRWGTADEVEIVPAIEENIEGGKNGGGL